MFLGILKLYGGNYEIHYPQPNRWLIYICWSGSICLLLNEVSCHEILMHIFLIPFANPPRESANELVSHSRRDYLLPIIPLKAIFEVLQIFGSKDLLYGFGLSKM